MVAVNGSPAARVQSGGTGGARRSDATARLQAGRKHNRSWHGMQRSSVAGAVCTLEEAGSAGRAEARDWLHRAMVARRTDHTAWPAAGRRARGTRRGTGTGAARPRPGCRGARRGMGGERLSCRGELAQVT
jgi:hypothetical protein